jgi:hypothetical protein
MSCEADKQRLYADWITYQENLAAAAVRDRESENAIELAEQSLTPFLPSVHEHLGIGFRREMVTCSLEFTAEVNVVVDLAVKRRPDRPIFVRHWLCAAFDVDDAEAAIADRELCDRRPDVLLARD